MNRLQGIRRLLRASVFAIFTTVANGLKPSYQDRCYRETVKILKEYTKNGTSDFANPLRYYDRAHDGRKIWDNRDCITLDACYQICGRRWELYPLTNILERISIWKIPLLLLVGNFQLAPLGRFNSICVIIHLLGDPIDTIWSLLTKLEVSRRLYTKWATISTASSDLEIKPAQAQDLAAVNAVFDDWLFSSEDMFDKMHSKLSSLPAEKRAVFIKACTKAAYKLSESRVDVRLRAYLAVVGYIVAIISAFFRTLNDGPSKMTAHSIAFAMCLVWLVPAVLLSSIVGGFTSRRAGWGVIYELQDKLGHLWPISDLDKTICESTIHRWTSTDTLDEALPYAGGNYSYRPSKCVFPSNAPADRRNEFAPYRSPVQLLFYATLPVVFAAGCAMALSCITPTIGLGCRTVTQMGFLLSWLSSVAVTAFLGIFLTGKYHWYTVLIKDCVITVVIAGFITAAFIGRYNGCFCWSAYFSRLGKAYVEINFEQQLMMLAKSLWPILVALGVISQGFILLLMRQGNAQGVMLFFRDEGEKQLYFAS